MANDMQHLCEELRTFSCTTVLIGSLVGLIGFLMNELDFLFGVVILSSSLLANVFDFFFTVFFRHLMHRNRQKWIGPLTVACEDAMRCFVMLQFSRFLFSAVGPFNIEEGDICQ